MFELSGMNNMLGPLKRMSFLTVSFREGINGLAHFPGRNSTQSSKRLPPQNAKPAFHLVQPGSMSGSVVEMDVRMSSQPPVMLGFMCVEIIQNDM